MKFINYFKAKYLGFRLERARKLLNSHGWSVVQAVKVGDSTYIKTGTGQLKRVGGKTKVRKV